jgi:hypothetical protein
MPILPSDGHRAHIFHGRAMFLVCVASLVLLVLGRWGLSYLDGGTAKPSVEHPAPAVIPVAVAPAPESPGNSHPKPSDDDGPSAAELASLFGDKPDAPATGESDLVPTSVPITDSRFSPDGQALVAKLFEEPMFAIGGVGYAGATSRGERLTRELARRADAIKAFDWLANQHRPVAQLYAYWALRTLAPAHARAHAAELHLDRRQVYAFHGCVGEKERVSDLAREVEAHPPLREP